MSKSQTIAMLGVVVAGIGLVVCGQWAVAGGEEDNAVAAGTPASRPMADPGRVGTSRGAVSSRVAGELPVLAPNTDTGRDAALLSAVPVPRVFPIVVPSEFFFSVHPWDVRRVLATERLNPRQVKLSARDEAALDAFIGKARDALDPLIKDLMQQCEDEFQRSIRGGTARSSRRKAKVSAGANGSVSIAMSLVKEGSGSPETVLQSFDGTTGTVYVAGWEDLPVTRTLRQSVATDVLVLVSRLLGDLEAMKILTAAECEDAMEDVMDHIRRF